MSIVIKGLTKKYKDTVAVQGLDLEIKTGELFALLGVNGAGKTTAIKMLCGLTKPTAGEAEILGISISDSKIKEIIAISPQETAVAQNLTVSENLRLMCGAYGLPMESCTEMIQKLGLTQVKDKKASKLSGGFMRRLSIAMALIAKPKVLFLDEPTLGIDVISRAELWELIESLKGEMTVVLTTHYMEEAERLSDRVGIMKAGHLIAVGTSDELKTKAGTEKFEDAFVKIVKEARV